MPSQHDAATTDQQSPSNMQPISQVLSFPDGDIMVVEKPNRAVRRQIKTTNVAELAAKEAAGGANDDRTSKSFERKGYKVYRESKVIDSELKKSSVPAASLTDCPCEIVMQIVANSSEREINALARCNSVLYKWLNQYLYETNIKSGRSYALRWAAASGSIGTIRLMITFGADIHSHRSLNLPGYQIVAGNNRTTGTALHIAVVFGHMEIVNLLLKEGADLEQRTSAPSEYSPLEIAMFFGNKSMAMYLLKKGANINAFDRSKRRPIDSILVPVAFRTFNEQISWLQILLEMGADVNRTSQTPLGQIRHPSPMEAALLMSHLGFPERAPIILDLLLEYGADVNETMDRFCVGATPLHVTSILGLTDTVKDLLSRGANVEARDSDNRTPLFWAVSTMHDCPKWRGRDEIVKMLLEHGADIEVRETLRTTSYPYNMAHRYHGGQTPQTIAAENSDRSFRAAFPRGLISRKVEVEHKRVEGDKSGPKC